MSGWLTLHRARPARPPAGRLTDLYTTAALAMIPLTIAVHTVLPPRFTYDSEVLGRIAAGQYNPLEDTSYLYVGRLYGFLGMAERPWAATVLGIGLAVAALYPALVRARGTATLPVYALVGLYTLTSSVYLGVYSKDVWVLVVVLVVLLSRAGLGGEAAVIASMCAYAYFFRGYWFLVLLIYLGLRVLTMNALTRGRVIAGVVLVTAAVTVLSPLALGMPIQDVREEINVGRLGSPDAQTAIWAPEFGLGVAGDALENITVLAGLIVPVDLLLEGSPEYVLYFTAIAVVWGLFARAVFVGTDRILDGRPAGQADTQVVRAALLTVAFLTTQGFFEPDYGSYLRHLTPMLVLVIVTVVGHPRSVFVAGTPAADRPEAVQPPHRGD